MLSVSLLLHDVLASVLTHSFIIHTYIHITSFTSMVKAGAGEELGGWYGRKVTPVEETVVVGEGEDPVEK
jgi:cytochrome b subunit of formate dehydrogenase